MARSLAIDLGTANTLVYSPGQDILYRQPTVIAVHRQTGEVLAMGEEAWRMIGRTPSYIVAHRPLRSGAITDFDMTEQMMRAIFHQVGVNRFNRPRVVICVPSALTLVEMRAVKLAARRAGAGNVLLMEQPIAAALGANLPIDKSVGNLIVDIGGGTTESGLISLGGVVALEAERVGSFAVDDAVQRYLRDTYDIAVGEQTAEKIKITIGSALDIGEDREMQVHGRRVSVSAPEVLTLNSGEIRDAIAGPLRAILNSILNCVSNTPPELANDIARTGLYLTGGGGLLSGIDQQIANEAGVPVRRVDYPLECVVRGAGRSLEALDLMRGMFVDFSDGD